MATRNTRQKQIVLDAARRLDHPTATEVYDALKREGATIGRATVFRVLKGYAEEGVLRRVSSDGGEIFDRTAERHYHLHCVCCGKVTDAALPYLEELTSLAGRGTDMELSFHEMDFFGICGTCRAKEE